MQREIELLVVRRLERREPRRDRVVRAGLDLDVVGRVRVAELDRRAVEQAVEIGRAGAIAAEQAVPPEHPEIPRLRRRLVGRLGHLVLVRQALDLSRVEQPGQFFLAEAQKRQVVARFLQSQQFDGQELRIPRRERGRLVVGDPVRTQLLG